MAIALGLVTMLGGAAWAAQEIAPAAAVPHPDVSFQGVRLWHWKGSALDGTGTSKTLVYDRSGGRGVATVAAVDLPGRRGDPRPSHLEAGVALGQLAGRSVDASAGVKLQRQDGAAVSNSAHYDGASRHITGTEAAAVDSARFHATGVGFDFDTARGTLELGGPVHATGEGAL